jgi:hypothetical protein
VFDNRVLTGIFGSKREVMGDGENYIVRIITRFSRILWRRPRPKLGCGAKERRRRRRTITSYAVQQILGNQIKEEQMDRACNTDEKCLHHFILKAWREENSSEI